MGKKDNGRKCWNGRKPVDTQTVTITWVTDCGSSIYWSFGSLVIDNGSWVYCFI